jgi:hypothetical protein
MRGGARLTGERKKGAPAFCGPCAGTYRRPGRLARGRNLFVLFDGCPAAPRLTFFAARGGC